VTKYCNPVFPTNPSPGCNAVFDWLLFNIRIASIWLDMLGVVTFLSASFTFKHGYCYVWLYQECKTSTT